MTASFPSGNWKKGSKGACGKMDEPVTVKLSIKSSHSYGYGLVVCLVLALNAIAMTVLVPLSTAMAAETSIDENLDEILEGFDDEQPSLGDTKSKDSQSEDSESEDSESEDSKSDNGVSHDNKTDDSGQTASRYSKGSNLKGFTQTSLSYNYAHQAPDVSGLPGSVTTDYRGLSQLKQSLQLEWNATIFDRWKILLSGSAYYDFVYGIHGRDEYTDQVLEEHETEAELRDAYLQGSLSPDLDIKIGRQIVVWGKSDSLRVVDVLNPLDNREPGMTDLEDLRLPVTMTRLNYYFGNWDLGAIMVHEIRLNKNPAFGSDFYPFPAPLPPENKPDGSEFALVFNGRFSGWDLSFHAARYYDDQAHLSAGVLEYSRLTLVGLAANVALGNWLLKSEAAYIDGLEFSNISNKKYSRTDFMAGMEYTGFNESTLTVEIVNRHLNQYDDVLSDAPIYQEKNVLQTVIRYRRDFKHNTWHLLALASVFGFGTSDGSFERLELKYDIADALSMTGGIVAYQPGDHPVFGAFEDNDRAFVKFRYSF